MPTKIIIGADIVPTKSNKEFFQSGKITEIIDENLLNVLSSASYRIFNLEVPLADCEDPIKKCGPNLIAPTKCVKGLQALNIDFVTLANNHIMDQGEQGLWSSVKTLEISDISYAGASKNIHEAAKPFLISLGGVRVGIYCCAEHEFSIADENSPGANPFDTLESMDHISDLKEKSDYVIILYHGGKELYQFPSPELQKRCRKMIDKGADLVICQHSHCIGCEEKWGQGTIVYGQGNFLFDYSTQELWKTGMLIEVSFLSGEEEITYVPLVKQGNGVSLAKDDRAAEILNGFKERSKKILNDGFVEKNYIDYALTQIENYMASNEFFLSNRVIRGIDKVLGHRIRKFYTDKKIKALKESILNQYECEAHRELIIQGLKYWEEI